MYNIGQGFWVGGLEVRQSRDGTTIEGNFPYESAATISDRYRVRKEKFRRESFKYSIEERTKDLDIHMLVGHDYGKPLGSRNAGSAKFTDTKDGVKVETKLPPESEQPTWMVDAVKAVKAGLLVGLSPGFRVPPSSVVPNAEELEEEEGNPGVMIRVINAAVLYEMSLVTRPAYQESEVNMRQFVTHYDDLSIPRRKIWL